jgi:hypothetical protein
LVLFSILLLFSASCLSCSQKEKNSEVNPRTKLGKLAQHQLPDFHLENFTENSNFAQSFYVNSQKHLYLTIRVQASPFDYQKKLNDEYAEKNKIHLAGHPLYEGIDRTDVNIAYLLVFEKGGLVYELHFRTSQGYFRPLSEIKNLARKIALKILQS